MSKLEIQRQITETLSFDRVNGWSHPFPELDSENTLIVVFASFEYCDLQEPFNEIRNEYPKSKIIGCSTPVASRNGDLIEGAISVGIIRFEKTEIRIAQTPVDTFDQSKAAGNYLGTQLADENLKGVLIFSDGVTTEATELVRGLQAALPPNVTIAGGLASNHTLDSTWVLCDGVVKPFHACAVGFIGNSVELARATGGGWRLVGSECKATKALGKTLFELDGEPAYEVYKRQVGSDAGYGLREASARYPLTVRLPGLEMQIVREIAKIHEDTGAIELAGDIPEGVAVQVAMTTAEEILDGVDEAVERMRSKTILPENNALAICVSCAARRAVLLDKSSEEASLAYEGLGVGIHQIGMFALGEISTNSSGPPQVHNTTITLGLIREY